MTSEPETPLTIGEEHEDVTPYGLIDTGRDPLSLALELVRTTSAVAIAVALVVIAFALT